MHELKAIYWVFLSTQKTQDKKLILSLDLRLEYPKRDFLVSLESLKDRSERLL